VSETTAAVDATMHELRSSKPADRAHVMRRLQDWQTRVHDLYASIEQGLGEDFVFDRAGKHRTAEEMVQRAGIPIEAVPAVDILRIERPKGQVLAIILPRYLWILGANGRLDLRLNRPGGRITSYALTDRSPPLSPKPRWYLVPGSDPTSQLPFSSDRLRELLPH
jgi:hypothetical protein